jgi:hypothetical protein
MIQRICSDFLHQRVRYTNPLEHFPRKVTGCFNLADWNAFRLLADRDVYSKSSSIDHSQPMFALAAARLPGPSALALSSSYARMLGSRPVTMRSDSAVALALYARQRCSEPIGNPEVLVNVFLGK